MATLNKYKNSERLPRNQLTEQKYSLGMHYTDAPIEEGYARLLVNYDAAMNKDMLTPRPGIYTSGVAVHPIKVTTDTALEYNELLSIAASKHCTELTKEFEHVLVNDMSDFERDPVSDLVKGAAYVLTVLPEGTTNETTIPTTFGEFKTQEIVTKALQTETGYCHFRQPANMAIHGMPVESTVFNSRLVGTFAYGNKFFYSRYEIYDAEEGTFGNQLMQSTYDEEEGYYAPVAVTPREVTPKEAVLWGYNMLKSNPYSFANTNATGTIQLQGLLPYTVNGDLIMSPIVNQTLKLECFYTAPESTTHKFVWDWKEPGAANWNVAKEESVDTGALSDVVCITSFPVAHVLVRITAYVGAETTPAQVLIIGLNLTKNSSSSTINTQPVDYTLAKSLGMVYWQRRLIFYGPPEGRNMLFASEVDDPSYVAYPNNVEIFSENILYAVPVLNNLVIFTTSEVYLLIPTLDGLSWTKTLLQNNLNIIEQDVHLIQVVKGMLYFKSGNYFYMLVPNKMNAGNLVMAPISRPIKGLLDEFETAVDYILKTLYNYTGTFNLVQYYNYLDYEEIHNNYVFELASGVLVDVVLIYHTTTRAWRLYVYEVPHSTYMHKPNALDKGTLIALTPIEQRYLVDTDVVTKTLTGLQFLDFDINNISDRYLVSNARYAPELSEVLIDDSDNPTELLEDQKIVFNYQMLDTGSREHNTDLKKRYRELQLKLNNVSKLPLNFYTDFYIDGGLSLGRYTYEVVHDVDPNSPTYGLLYVERHELDPHIVPLAVMNPGITVLAESIEDVNYWTLNNAMFPDMTFWKIRIPVVGKGYTPRLVLVSANEKRYELLSNSWVYREMYSR